jgi:L-ascorbate metabolism protein UlaG (beta-lactamase superfamily)
LDINWLGHSCFRIKGKEAVIITDPFDPSIGYSLKKASADIVTISHFHPGHSHTDVIDGDFKIIRSPGEYEQKGVYITGIASFHDSIEGSERGKNTVYIIEIDGVTICHLGDIGHLPSSHMEEEIGEVGILFIPVGGFSTIDSSIASDAVRSLSPKIIIPMHYKTPKLTRELDPVDNFLSKLGVKEVVAQPRLTINRSTLPVSTQVVVLESS